MKRNIVSAAAAAALVMLSLPAPASAATTDLGTLVLPYNQGFTSGTLNDVTSYTFTVAVASAVDWSATSVTSSIFTTDLASATLEVLEGTTVIATSAFFKEGSAYFADVSALVSAGVYTIQVVGSSGTAAISETASVAASVPEISTWAMMLAGFGALGFVRYRRRALAI